jgi:alcohol dehydrogenase class IV
MEMNLKAARENVDGAATVARYTDVARWLTGRSAASAEDGIAWVRALVTSLQIPRLASHGVTPEHAMEIIVRAKSANSMKANPFMPGDHQLAGALAQAM